MVALLPTGDLRVNRSVDRSGEEGVQRSRALFSIFVVKQGCTDVILCRNDVSSQRHSRKKHEFWIGGAVAPLPPIFSRQSKTIAANCRRVPPTAAVWPPFAAGVPPTAAVGGTLATFGGSWRHSITFQPKPKRSSNQHNTLGCLLRARWLVVDEF